MADSFIQVAPDSTGKMMQTYLNTISANAVHAEAVALVDINGNPITTLNVNVGSSINANFTGTVNIAQSNASLLNATVSQGGTWNIGTLTSITNPVTVQQTNASNFLATVSGTVTATGPITNTQLRASEVAISAASLPLPSLAATSTKQSDGSQKSQVVDGAGNVIGATSNALDVNVKSIAAAQTIASITTVGTITNPVGMKELPDSTATYAPTVASSTAYANNIIIKASPGVLYNLTGYNSKTSSQFILLLNATTVLGNGNATSFPALNVPAGQTFSLDFGGKFGRFFSTGMVVVNSSTANTVTIGSADCWFDALYS